MPLLTSLLSQSGSLLLGVHWRSSQEEELKAMLAHECGHLDTALFHRVTGIASLPFLLAVVTALALARCHWGFLSTNTVLALLEPVETPRLFTSTLTAALALATTFTSVIYQRMLGELVADVSCSLP